MRTGSKLVDKVWILALVFAAPILLVSCGDSDSRPELEPAQVIAAADSADNVLTGKLTILRDSANKPSVFFDTLYRSYAAARMIEVQKRVDADSLARAGVLAIHNMKEQAVRQTGIRTLYAFMQRDSIRASRIDSLRNSLRSSIGRMIDSSSLSPDDKQALLSEITSLRRFIPDYRRELDSLTHGTVQVEIEMLHFLDEAARRIRFEEVLRFTDANDLARYQTLTTRLGELAMAQQVLVDRVTYGVQPDSSLTDSTAAPAPTARPPVQTWPDAVRVQ